MLLFMSTHLGWDIFLSFYFLIMWPILPNEGLTLTLTIVSSNVNYLLSHSSTYDYTMGYSFSPGHPEKQALIFTMKQRARYYLACGPSWGPDHRNKYVWTWMGQEAATVTEATFA